MPVEKKSSMWSARRSSDAMTPRTPATGNGYPETETKQDEEQIISLGAKAKVGDKAPVAPPLPPPSGPSPPKAADEGVVSLGKPRPPRQPTAAASEGDKSSTGEQSLPLNKFMPIKLPDVPMCFLCPISQQVMKDPVTAADGVTYERERIEALLRSGRRDSPATGQPLQSTDLCANADLRTAVEGYLGLRREAERQWAELEVNISQYMAQVGLKLEQNDQQVHELQKQVQLLEGNGGRSKATPRSSTTSTAASPSPPEVSSEPPMLPLRTEDDKPAAECPFSAGPAPRSARGNRPPMPSPANRAGGGTPAGTPAGQTSASPFFGGLKASLTPRLGTPRLSHFGFTPRGRGSSQTPR